MAALELAVVVPTFRERENIQLLLDRLALALIGIEYEVIFVDDDSPDQTAAIIRAAGISNSRVRLLQRIHRRGLASACIEGMMATAAPYIAVMDADLQHDESILPRMLNTLKSERLDVVVASRNANGGSMGHFASSRVGISNLGRRLSGAISRCALSDPMSGFFVLDRRFLEEVVHSVSAIGFKILLDIVASSRRPVRFAEVPYRFRERLHGESKLDILAALEYLQLLLDKTIGDIVPPRFVIFGIVGALGVLAHLAFLFLLMRLAHQTFLSAQILGTFAVMTLNFFLNNAITYRDRRLRGAAMVHGLLSFYTACSVGTFVNLRVASFAAENGLPWYAAGFLGLAVSSVWNYTMTAILIWRQQRREAGRGRVSPTIPVSARSLAS